MFFFKKKNWYAQPVPSTVYNQKNYFLLVGSGAKTIYNPSNTNFSFQYMLKSLEASFKTISKVMSKYKNKTKMGQILV